jgi:diacylglycerol kinase family enzyme
VVLAQSRFPAGIVWFTSQADEVCTSQVTLESKLEYELDGGARAKTKKFTAEVVPAAVKICVPSESDDG